MKQEHVARLRRRPGQCVFEINIQTGKITNLGSPRRVDMKEWCIYRMALNEKNLIRKLVNAGMLKKIEAPNEEI